MLPPTPANLFDYCPRCAAPRSGPPGAIPFVCSACDFCLFFNPAVAAAGFLFNDRGEVLFLVRANEPAKGLLAIPGGFVDAGENAEDALRREVREEVGLEVEAIRYVGTFPNQYPYRGVTYPVVDIVFQARALAPESARPLDGCAALLWRKLDTLDDAELAFPSIRAGRRLLTAGLGGG